MRGDEEDIIENQYKLTMEQVELDISKVSLLNGTFYQEIYYNLGEEVENGC